MKRLLLLALLLLPLPAAAQSLDLTNSVGRTINFTTGEWTIASIPGLEFCAGPIAISASGYYDREGWFARELSISLSREFNRLTVSGSVGSFWLRGYSEPDRYWSVDLRWRLWNRSK